MVGHEFGKFTRRLIIYWHEKGIGPEVQCKTIWGPISILKWLPWLLCMRKDGRPPRMETGWPVKFLKQLLPNHLGYYLKGRLLSLSHPPKLLNQNLVGIRQRLLFLADSSGDSLMPSEAGIATLYYTVAILWAPTKELSSISGLCSLWNVHVFILLLCFNHMSSIINNGAGLSGSNCFGSNFNLGLILLFILPSLSLSLLFIFISYKYYFLVFMHPF